MFKTIYNILTTKNPNLFFLKWSLIFAFLVILLILYRSIHTPQSNREGFHQKEPFVVKRNEDAMDTFYAEMYDSLHSVNKRVDKELIHILNTTNPSTKHSVFLDVGSGTGHILNELNEAGYNAYGIEKSQQMIDYSKDSYPDIEVLHGDILEPMSFEKHTFTHVLCTYFTIYNLSDKLQFFRNCYHWMQPGGYLIIHLVDKNKFEKIIPHEMAMSERTAITPERCNLKTKAIFTDFEYKGNYELSKQTDEVTFIETMTDLDTKHIRQNEITLHMEDLEVILSYAKRAGFLQHAKTTMLSMNGDSNQYLYYFERPL